MNLIVAMDQNRGIGKSGGLLTHLSGDLKYFKEQTLGKTVVMGYNTLLSLPGSKPLKDRDSIILIDQKIDVPGARVCHSIPEVFDAVKDLDPDSVFICGGASVYRQFLPYCTLAYITQIEESFDADVFFPPLDGFVLESRSEPMEEHGVRYRFCVYRNQTVKEAF